MYRDFIRDPKLIGQKAEAAYRDKSIQRDFSDLKRESWLWNDSNYEREQRGRWAL